MGPDKYARHPGVSLKAVRKEVAAGRIKQTEAGQIDVEAADDQWARNTAPRPNTAQVGVQQTN